MWVVLLINTLVAAFLAFFSFRNRHEAFNLFNAGIVFIVFGLVLLVQFQFLKISIHHQC